MFLKNSLLKFTALTLFSKTIIMRSLAFFTLSIVCCFTAASQQTQKPVIHGKQWMAITGKPLAATAGSMVFQQGGNAVDAACAMLAATCTMWDVCLRWYPRR